MSKRSLSQLIPILIVALLLWWVLRSVSPGEVWAVLRRLRPVDLLMLTLANLIVLWLLTARWWILLAALDIRIPVGKLLGYRLAAFGVSYFTPGPHFGGEPLQVYLPARNHGAPTSAALAAVTMDKTLELLVNFAFLVAAAIFVLQQGLLPGGSGVSFIGYGLFLLALPVGLLGALWAGRHPFSALLTRLTQRWPNPTLARTAAGAYRSEEQAAWLCRQRPGAVLGALSFALLAWAAMIGEYWLAAYVLGLDLSLGQAILAMLAARVAILLPLPAGLGALEASQVMAMEALGVGAAAGLSLALLIRTRDVILGLAGLWIGQANVWPGRLAPRRFWRLFIVALCMGGALFAAPAGQPLMAQGGTVPNPVLDNELFLPLVANYAMSTRVYDAIPVDRGAGFPCQPSERPAANNADLNLVMRGYAETDAPLTLVDIDGPTDPNAPQLPGLFADRRLPAFTAAYQVYDWDWGCGEEGCRGELLTNWPVTLLGMATAPGETVTIPTRGPEIYGGGYKALVLYAMTNRLTLAYTRHDTAACGYLIHIEDIFVDPALLALYREMNEGGRAYLPALRNDEPLGSAIGGALKIAVRDSGQFMDPRARKDWWQGYLTQ